MRPRCAPTPAPPHPGIRPTRTGGYVEDMAETKKIAFLVASEGIEAAELVEARIIELR